MRTRRALCSPGRAEEEDKLHADSGNRPTGPQDDNRRRTRQGGAKQVAEEPQPTVAQKRGRGRPKRKHVVDDSTEDDVPAPIAVKSKTAAVRKAPASPPAKPPAAAPLPSPSGRHGPSLPQRSVPASPSRPRPQAPAAAQQPAPAAATPAPVPTWGVAEDAARKQAEDAAVGRAVQSGRFVELAVHSFISAIPPSRLALPEDATINFLRRQIQYRVEESGTRLPADALEIQVKDTWGSLTTTTSFTTTGAEKTIKSYGLVPGPQHHIWVIVVDDTAARQQRSATAALTQLPGPSSAGPSDVAAAPPPPPRMSEQALQAVAEYQAALSPERPAAQDEAAPTAAASESPGKRRKSKNRRFSAEEITALVEGVLILGTGHWAAIRDRYSTVFAPGRNSVDLKDKWRNLVKLVQEQRTARGTTLPREIAVKIMEVLHREDEA